MRLRDLLTRRNLLVASLILIVGVAVSAYFALRRPPRVEMGRYVPASALAYVEINNFSDLVGGLTSTKAWQELAPALGISDDISQVGLAADLMGRTGVGRDEAVIAGRAQLALVLTGIEAESGTGEEGAYINLKPRFAAVVETHSSSAVARRLAEKQATALARNSFGESINEERRDYFGAQLLIFPGPRPDRQLVAASSGSVIIISNHIASVETCLDAIAGRAPAIAEDATLRERRGEVDADGAVFAFITEAGIEKLIEVLPALLASRFTTDPDRVSSIANLLDHLLKQTTSGLLYSAQFESGGVTEKYLTVLRPNVAAAIAEPLKSATRANLESLNLVPRQVEDFTILNVEGVGELPDRMLKQLVPRLDVVAGLALREFVLSLRKQFGLEATDRVGDALGNEVTLVRFGGSEPTAMIVRVKDKPKIVPILERYLAEGGSKTSTVEYNAVQVSVSSHEDNRAAAFVGEFLILATRDQIAKMIDAEANNDGLGHDERLAQVLTNPPARATIISYKPEVRDAAEMMMAVAAITKSGPADQSAIDAALDRVPPSLSFTEFRDYGIVTQSRSAVGNFSLLSTFAGR
ncbi:MAG TPA: hypothetical protein VF131_27135 [Blastocatellia bacterium]|nr:hypothetical protein [Blastocatellia bacterium]